MRSRFLGHREPIDHVYRIVVRNDRRAHVAAWNFEGLALDDRDVLRTKPKRIAYVLNSKQSFLLVHRLVDRKRFPIHATLAVDAVLGDLFGPAADFLHP